MKVKMILGVAGWLMVSGMMAQTTRSASISLNRNTKYQYIDGFGGTGMNGQWGDEYNGQSTKVNLLWGSYTKNKKYLGLNIMRVRINPNESNWGEYGYGIKLAKRNGAIVFATPWTPPKKYKTSKTYNYQNDYGTWVWPIVEHSWGGEGSNGGAINPEHYDDYADFLERYRATMKKKGYTIDMISIQNECDYTPTATDNGVEHASYESCIYSPKEMAAMVKAARAKVDPECLIMGPECFGWGEHSYNNTLVNLKDAVDNIDVWGNHLYGTNDWSFVETVTRKTKRKMWMTEFLIDYDSNYTGQFSYETSMIKSLEDAMQAGYSAYVYYNMLNDFFKVSFGGSGSALNKRGNVFGHYARYATGKTRIKHTLSDLTGKLVGGSSYASTSGDTLTLFILNPTEDTYKFNVILPFIPTQVTQMTTSDTDDRELTDITSEYEWAKRTQVLLQPGTFYTFEFVYNEDQVGVESAKADEADKVREVRYFTVGGAEVTKPAKGTYVEKILYGNGTQKTRVVRK